MKRLTSLFIILVCAAFIALSIPRVIELHRSNRALESYFDRLDKQQIEHAEWCANPDNWLYCDEPCTDCCPNCKDR